jgi:hypothetical protein
VRAASDLNIDAPVSDALVVPVVWLGVVVDWMVVEEDVVAEVNKEQPVRASAKASAATADRASKMDLVDFTADRYLLCVFKAV